MTEKERSTYMIDPNLKRILRMVAAYHNMDMGDYIEQAIREKIKRDEVIHNIQTELEKQ